LLNFYNMNIIFIPFCISDAIIFNINLCWLYILQLLKYP